MADQKQTLFPASAGGKVVHVGRSYLADSRWLALECG